MINRNKNFHTFFGLAGFLGLIVITASQKLFPLFQHTVYYCQTFIHSLSLHIPYQASWIIPLILMTLLLTACLKFILVITQTNRLRKKLVSQIITFNKLHKLLEKHKLAKKTYIVESHKPFAFCFGIRNPKIYLSTTTIAIMNEKELEAILIHEKYHLDNKDTFIMLFASVCQSLFPFFPLLSDLLHNYRIEREIKADQRAIEKLGSSQPIISVLKKLLIQPSFVITAPAIADHDTLEPRINALVKREFAFKKYRKFSIFLSTLSVLILLVVVLSPVNATEIHIPGQDILMVCPDGDECIASCTKQMMSKVNPTLQVNASHPFTPSQ